ncbi:MAG: hypothetical protein ABWZ82_09935, partial [Candidatus Limnocylindrales bacterium]
MKRRALAPLRSLAVLAVLATGCGGSQVQDTPRPLATPVASLGSALAGTAQRVTQALDAAGYRVAPPVVP